MIASAAGLSAIFGLPIENALEDQRTAPALLDHSTSFQEAAGSNCSFVPGLKRGEVGTLWRGRECCGRCGGWCRASSCTSRAASPSSRGVRRQSRRPRTGRCEGPYGAGPRICRSSVRTSAEQLGALARSIRLSTIRRSRMTLELDQNGFVVTEATSRSSRCSWSTT